MDLAGGFAARKVVAGNGSSKPVAAVSGVLGLVRRRDGDNNNASLRARSREGGRSNKRRQQRRYET